MGLVKMVAGSDYLKGPNLPTSGNRSLAFADGGSEKLAQTPVAPAAGSFSCSHALQNKFSIAVWFKRELSTLGNVFLFAQNTTGHGRVFVDVTTLRIVVTLAQPGVLTVDKLYRYNNTDTAWQHIVLVVERGATEELSLYINGNFVTPTQKVTDLSLTSRSGLNMTFMDDIGNSLSGNIYSLAIWDTALKANEIPVIYNGGKAPPVNLLNNFGKYKSGKKCRHWFVFEGNAGNMGKDYGRKSKEGLNLMTSQVGITAADDLVFDAPA